MDTTATMQSSVLTHFQTADAQLKGQQGSLRVVRTAVYVFAMLHILILAIAGYFIVQLQWPDAAKLFFLVAACCVSVWILYQCFHQP